MSRLLLGGVLVVFLTGCFVALAEDTTPGSDDNSCSPIAQLSPNALGGSLVPPDGAAADGPWRWRTEKGDRLRLRLRTKVAGDHAIVLRMVPTPGGPRLSMELWGIALRLEGQARFALPLADDGSIRELRLDPFPLSPGFQTLELESHGDGEFLLQCIGTERTGPRSGGIRWPAVEIDERPFLGVQLGAADTKGIGVDRVYAGTAAKEIGLMAGDVIVRVGGISTTTTQDLIAAIQAQSLERAVDIEWLRNEERFSRKAKLGHRLDEDVMRADQAVDVLEALAVRPGQTVADIGCGSGWLARAVAMQVGEKGTVYAVEIQTEQILQLHRRGITRVIPVLSEPDDVALPEDSLDIAVLHDVASHIERRARSSFYKSLTRALKPSGRLVVFGPHGNAETMLNVLRENGFVAQAATSLEGLTAEELDRKLEEGISFVPLSSTH